jgi:Cyclic nucleotide-binding domain
MWGLPVALIGVFPSEAAALGLLACVGVANTLVDFGLQTLMARLASDEVLARVSGVLESVIALTVGIGAVVASLVIDLSSLRVALVVIGALCPLAAAAGWLRLRHLDESIGIRDRDIALLQRVAMLTPLPLPAIERLARGLQLVSVAAGDLVVSQGDVGDRFYVIESGEADVIGDGRLVATLGPGEGFGEIALLRRVRRTATVRAATGLRLQVLASDHFLPIVTGFTPSAREAGTSVDTMLDRFRPTRSA